MSTSDPSVALDRRRLDELAKEIRVEIGLAEQRFAEAVQHAINAGERLIEVKAALPHGQWTPWLAQNFEFTDRTARNYMRLAANRKQVSGLPTVREALAVLAEPRPPRELPLPEPESDEPRREDFKASDHGDREHLAAARITGRGRTGSGRSNAHWPPT